MRVSMVLDRDTHAKVTFFQATADSLDKGVRTYAIITDFSKAFDLVPRDRLLTKIAATGVDFRVVVWIKGVDGQLSEEVRVNIRSASSERIRSSIIPNLC
jgi:hypothetical protein